MINLANVAFELARQVRHPDMTLHAAADLIEKALWEIRREGLDQCSSSLHPTSLAEQILGKTHPLMDMAAAEVFTAKLNKAADLIEAALREAYAHGWTDRDVDEQA